MLQRINSNHEEYCLEVPRKRKLHWHKERKPCTEIAIANLANRN